MSGTFSVEPEPEFTDLISALQTTKDSLEQFEVILSRLRVQNAELKEQNRMLHAELENVRSQVRLSS